MFKEGNIPEDSPLFGLEMNSSVGKTLDEIRQESSDTLLEELEEYEKHKEKNKDTDIYAGVRVGHMPLNK